jgi:glycosyltransferase involved in cell wall biosynthesis
MACWWPPQEELEKNRCRPRSIEVWQRGVDTDVFNPKHKSAAMRARMSDGHPEAPLLVYVGRLGAEKNTEALKDILMQVRRVQISACYTRVMLAGLVLASFSLAPAVKEQSSF